MAHPLWPLFDLRIRVEPIELRLPNDAELVALAAVARAGMHPSGEMPFGVAWSTVASPDFERSFIRHHWGARASWQSTEWSLQLAAFLDDRPVGAQELFARSFPTVRKVGSGSWLGLGYQGRGLGKAMRTGVLALAFDRLGAEVAESEAFLDNDRSAGVSRSLGYEENGLGRLAPEGIARDTQRFRMTRDGWRSRPRPEVVVEGLEGCLELFGLEPRPRDGD